MVQDADALPFHEQKAGCNSSATCHIVDIPLASAVFSINTFDAMKANQPSIIQLRYESMEYEPLRKAIERGECNRDAAEWCIACDYLDQQSRTANLENN